MAALLRRGTRPSPWLGVQWLLRRDGSLKGSGSGGSRTAQAGQLRLHLLADLTVGGEVAGVHVGGGLRDLRTRGDDVAVLVDRLGHVEPAGVVLVAGQV